MAETDLAGTYDALRALVARAAPTMTVAREGPTEAVLVAAWPNPLKPAEPMWFGSLSLKKAYVSLYLMPIYTHPSLAADISPALSRRRQGKSCFNFKTPDPALLTELEGLTARAAALYARPFDVAEGAC